MINKIQNFLDSGLKTIILSVFGFLLLISILLSLFWSSEPNVFSVLERATQVAEEKQLELVVGVVTTSTVITLAETLLDKSGGYLTNDVLPPGLWLDNIPNWEFGVLVQIRDISKVLRQNFSRSQSQSVEDPDLVIAEPGFNYSNDSWILPSTEGEYRDAIEALDSYLLRLADPQNQQAQFYARADNLVEWLRNVESRLGSLSQRLSASVGQNRINTDLAGDVGSELSTPVQVESIVQTAWLQRDDVFYEARGTAWALIHFLRAIQIDFDGVLEDKNARVIVEQIIRELEATQSFIFSPIILNGSGFGLVANHSLVMASYMSRANAAIIDLRSLLNDG